MPEIKGKTAMADRYRRFAETDPPSLLPALRNRTVRFTLLKVIRLYQYTQSRLQGNIVIERNRYARVGCRILIESQKDTSNCVNNPKIAAKKRLYLILWNIPEKVDI